MVICSMEIKKLLVSKLWNHLRISTGLICIAVIREQGIQNNPIQNSGEENAPFISLYTTPL